MTSVWTLLLTFTIRILPFTDLLLKKYFRLYLKVKIFLTANHKKLVEALWSQNCHLHDAWRHLKASPLFWLAVMSWRNKTIDSKSLFIGAQVWILEYSFITLSDIGTGSVGWAHRCRMETLCHFYESSNMGKNISKRAILQQRRVLKEASVVVMTVVDRDRFASVIVWRRDGKADSGEFFISALAVKNLEWKIVKKVTSEYRYPFFNSSDFYRANVLQVITQLLSFASIS